MSLNPANIYNIAMRQPINERALNNFQLQFKYHMLVRRHFGGDRLTDRVWRKHWVDSGRRDMILSLGNLERRLDFIAFRAGWTSSIFEARRLVCFGNLAVNGIIKRIPGDLVKDGDLIQVLPERQGKARSVLDHCYRKVWGFIPSYLEVNPVTLSAVFLHQPKWEEIPSPYPRKMIDYTSLYYTHKY